MQFSTPQPLQSVALVCSFKSDWLMAMKYAERLCKESRWSKATYTYQKASFLLMCDDQTEETKAHLKYLFRYLTAPVSL